MKYLFIAEKPSLMRDVRSCYKNHIAEIQRKVGNIDFIALSGHVCTNFSPNDYEQWGECKWDETDYPMIPTKWGIKPIDDNGKRRTLSKIKQIARKYDGIIVGTDSDVEGYGIYYLLEQYLNLSNMKALRFIEHSLTDKEILKSLLEMTDYHKDPTHIRFTQSFLIRSRADWLYGMNATQMLTVKQRELMRVGRVKAPTIKLIYDNSVAIENFKQRKYFVLNANYESFSSVLLDKTGHPMQFDHVNQIPSYPLEGIVKDKKTKQTQTHAPKLFDLASAQAEAGRVFGYTPDKTLELLQSLYEKHKVISYPRTQCRYVSTEKAKEFPMMIKHVSVFEDLRKIAEKLDQSTVYSIANDKQVVNDSEVQKESHDALLPTSNRPNLDTMTQDEQNICHMIFQRLVAQFMNKLTEDRTRLLINHGDGVFLVTGKIVKDPGWSILYSNIKDNVIPNLNKGDCITADRMTPAERKTMPPKRLTQATLVDAMCNIANHIDDKELKKSLSDSKGIGTPATRAAIISDILKTGYAEDKKGGLYVTDLGKKYIDAVKSLDITYPVFAAQLDSQIKKVQRGEAEYQTVWNDVLNGLKNMCIQIGKMEQKNWVPKLSTSQCPSCNTALEVSKYTYNCPNCGLKIRRYICGREIDEKLLNRLTSGKISPMLSFEKKDGTLFKSCLVLRENGEIKFTSGLRCPVCKHEMNLNRGGAFCDCGVQIFRKIAGHNLTDQEIKKLITKEEVKGITDFVSKSGKQFNADIVLKEGKIKLVYN